jgi:hypothetical protein
MSEQDTSPPASIDEAWSGPSGGPYQRERLRFGKTVDEWWEEAGRLQDMVSERDEALQILNARLDDLEAERLCQRETCWHDRQEHSPKCECGCAGFIAALASLSQKEQTDE